MTSPTTSSKNVFAGNQEPKTSSSKPISNSVQKMCFNETEDECEESRTIMSTQLQRSYQNSHKLTMMMNSKQRQQQQQHHSQQMSQSSSCFQQDELSSQQQSLDSNFLDVDYQMMVLQSIIENSYEQFVNQECILDPNILNDTGRLRFILIHYLQQTIKKSITDQGEFDEGRFEGLMGDLASMEHFLYLEYPQLKLDYDQQEEVVFYQQMTEQEFRDQYCYLLQPQQIDKIIQTVQLEQMLWRDYNESLSRNQYNKHKREMTQGPLDAIVGKKPTLFDGIGQFSTAKDQGKSKSSQQKFKVSIRREQQQSSGNANENNNKALQNNTMKQTKKQFQLFNIQPLQINPSLQQQQQQKSSQASSQLLPLTTNNKTNNFTYQQFVANLQRQKQQQLKKQQQQLQAKQRQKQQKQRKDQQQKKKRSQFDEILGRRNVEESDKYLRPFIGEFKKRETESQLKELLGLGDKLTPKQQQNQNKMDEQQTPKFKSPAEPFTHHHHYQQQQQQQQSQQSRSSNTLVNPLPPTNNNSKGPNTANNPNNPSPIISNYQITQRDSTNHFKPLPPQLSTTPNTANNNIDKSPVIHLVDGHGKESLQTLSLRDNKFINGSIHHDSSQIAHNNFQKGQVVNGNRRQQQNVNKDQPVTHNIHTMPNGNPSSFANNLPPTTLSNNNQSTSKNTNYNNLPTRQNYLMPQQQSYTNNYKNNSPHKMMSPNFMNNQNTLLKPNSHNAITNTTTNAFSNFQANQQSLTTNNANTYYSNIPQNNMYPVNNPTLSQNQTYLPSGAQHFQHIPSQSYHQSLSYQNNTAVGQTVNYPIHMADNSSHQQNLPPFINKKDLFQPSHQVNSQMKYPLPNPLLSTMTPQQNQPTLKTVPSLQTHAKSTLKYDHKTLQTMTLHEYLTTFCQGQLNKIYSDLFTELLLMKKRKLLKIPINSTSIIEKFRQFSLLKIQTSQTNKNQQNSKNIMKQEQQRYLRSESFPMMMILDKKLRDINSKSFCKIGKQQQITKTKSVWEMDNITDHNEAIEREYTKIQQIQEQLMQKLSLLQKQLDIRDDQASQIGYSERQQYFTIHSQLASVSQMLRELEIWAGNLLPNDWDKNHLLSNDCDKNEGLLFQQRQPLLTDYQNKSIVGQQRPVNFDILSTLLNSLSHIDSTIDIMKQSIDLLKK